MKKGSDKKRLYRASMPAEDVDFLARVKYAIDTAKEQKPGAESK